MSMKLRCKEEEIKGMTQKEAMQYSISVYIPVDMELYIKLYNLHPHQKGSDTLDKLLKKIFYEI